MFYVCFYTYMRCTWGRREAGRGFLDRYKARLITDERGEKEEPSLSWFIGGAGDPHLRGCFSWVISQKIEQGRQERKVCA